MTTCLNVCASSAGVASHRRWACLGFSVVLTLLAGCRDLGREEAAEQIKAGTTFAKAKAAGFHLDQGVRTIAELMRVFPGSRTQILRDLFQQVETEDAVVDCFESRQVTELVRAGVLEEVAPSSSPTPGESKFVWANPPWSGNPNPHPCRVVEPAAGVTLMKTGSTTRANLWVTACRVGEVFEAVDHIESPGEHERVALFSSRLKVDFDDPWKRFGRAKGDASLFSETDILANMIGPQSCRGGRWWHRARFVKSDEGWRLSGSERLRFDRD